jgi:hypothetical protein
MKKLRPALVILLFLAQISIGSVSVRADIITQIATPFYGNAIETWDELPGGDASSPLSIFGGLATISGDYPFIWTTAYSLGTPGGLGLGPFDARAFDGTHGYVTSVSGGSADIVFATPVTDFGGYWGYSADGYPPAIFTFYDSHGSVIGSEDFTYTSPNNDGTLEWQGWHSSVPIGSISYTGYWVADDSLRIVTVPEPGISVLSTCFILIFCKVRKVFG